MMEELKKYIYTIVVAMIFVTFIEILMPNSAMKKYTKVILGLLIMTVILNPIILFINKDFSLTGYSFKFQNQLDSLSLQKQSYDYTDNQSQKVTKLYKQNLKSQMEQQIKGLIGDNDISVDVEIIEDIKSEEYGQITKVTLTVNSSIKTVEKIDINIGDNSSPSPKKASNEYQVLKEKVSSMYGIDREKIIIIES